MPRVPGRGTATAGTRPGARDEGTATAELAVVLPAFTLVVAAALSAVAVVTAQLRCTDAAAVAARAMARGETTATARADALAAAPAGADVSLTSAGGAVTVTVSVRTGPAVGPLHLPTVSARQSEPLEPGVFPR
jgi:Flp pilus assembly protein TadG